MYSDFSSHYAQDIPVQNSSFQNPSFQNFPSQNLPSYSSQNSSSYNLPYSSQNFSSYNLPSLPSQNLSSQNLYSQNPPQNFPSYNLPSFSSQNLFSQNPSQNFSSQNLSSQNQPQNFSSYNLPSITSQNFSSQNLSSQNLSSQNQPQNFSSYNLPSLTSQNSSSQYSIPHHGSAVQSSFPKTTRQENNIFEYSVSGNDLDIEYIRRQLMESGVSDITTEGTPYGNTINVKIQNQTQGQIQSVRKILNIRNRISPIEDIFSIISGFPMMIEMPFRPLPSRLPPSEERESGVTITEVTDV